MHGNVYDVFMDMCTAQGMGTRVLLHVTDTLICKLARLAAAARGAAPSIGRALYKERAQRRLRTGILIAPSAAVSYHAYVHVCERLY